MENLAALADDEQIDGAGSVQRWCQRINKHRAANAVVHLDPSGPIARLQGSRHFLLVAIKVTIRIDAEQNDPAVGVAERFYLRESARNLEPVAPRGQRGRHLVHGHGDRSFQGKDLDIRAVGDHAVNDLRSVWTFEELRGYGHGQGADDGVRRPVE